MCPCKTSVMSLLFLHKEEVTWSLQAGKWPGKKPSLLLCFDLRSGLTTRDTPVLQQDVTISYPYSTQLSLLLQVLWGSASWLSTFLVQRWTFSGEYGHFFWRKFDIWKVQALNTSNSRCSIHSRMCNTGKLISMDCLSRPSAVEK